MNRSVIVALVVPLGIAVVLSTVASNDGRAETIVEPGQTVFFTAGDDFELDTSSCSGLNECIADAETERARLKVKTVFAAGVDETKHAQATLHNRFTLSGDPQLERVLRANLSGAVSWSGSVAIVAAAGPTDATINAWVRLTDTTEGRVVAEERMVDSSCSTDWVGGGCVRYPEGSNNYNLSVDLIRGHEYRFDLIARCESYIGAAATEVRCDFLEGPNHVSRGQVRLYVSRDLEAEIDALWAELNELKSRFNAHTHTYLTGQGEGHNNTPATTTTPTTAEPSPPPPSFPFPSPPPPVQPPAGSRPGSKVPKKPQG